MSPIERRELIKQYEAEIEIALCTSNFVLNGTIVKLNRKIDELRADCIHSFNNGLCEYCGLPIEFYNKEK